MFNYVLLYYHLSNNKLSFAHTAPQVYTLVFILHTMRVYLEICEYANMRYWLGTLSITEVELETWLT
jgi:hypothetical protein